MKNKTIVWISVVVIAISLTVLLVISIVSLNTSKKSTKTDKYPLNVLEEIITRPEKNNLNGKETLGISYDQVMKNLSNHFVMQKEKPIHGIDNYIGKAGFTLLQIIGNKNDIYEVIFVMGLAYDMPKQIVEYHASLAGILILNIFPDWNARDIDHELAILFKKVVDVPNSSQMIYKGKKKLEIEHLEPGFIIITISHS